MKDKNRIIVFDTTLRDGEQSPGASMNTAEKVRIATQLERLGVDVIEAGFPAASRGDLDAVRAIAQKVRGLGVAALARTSKEDIDKAWEAIRDAARPRIHTFIATSDIHMEHKLRMRRDEVIAATVEAVKYAKKFTDDVEFSAEDASRSDRDFLCRVFEAAIEAGAATVNVPDTVGYILPDAFNEMIRYVKTHTPNLHRAVLSVHCHNDQGLATANNGQHPDRTQSRSRPGRGHGERDRRESREHLAGRGGHDSLQPPGTPRLVYGDKHPRNLSNEQIGFHDHGYSHSTQQGGGGRQRLCSRSGDSPGRRAKEPVDL